MITDKVRALTPRLCESCNRQRVVYVVLCDGVPFAICGGCVPA